MLCCICLNDMLQMKGSAAPLAWHAEAVPNSYLSNTCHTWKQLFDKLTFKLRGTHTHSKQQWGYGQLAVCTRTIEMH